VFILVGPIVVWYIRLALQTMSNATKQELLPATDRDTDSKTWDTQGTVPSPLDLVAQGDLLLDRDDLGGAMEYYRSAFQLDPDDMRACDSLGALSLVTGDFSCAAWCYRRLLKQQPDVAEFHCHLGNALFFGGDLEQGTRHFRRALQLDPGYVEASLGVAFAFLTQGDFLPGWVHYERRFDSTVVQSHNALGPRWNGEALFGRTILLHAEQGLGDTLQFVRYAPMVAAQGGRVVLEVQPALRRLLSRLGNVETIISQREIYSGVDLHCPLLSLPAVFGTTLATIPAPSPYLHAEPQRVRAWSRSIGDTFPRVGLVWAGEPQHRRDRQRSISLTMLAPLGSEGVSFFSLQKGPAAEQLKSLPPEFRVEDLDADCSDMCDTAAAIMALDLVISVDTSIAHLAAALGKPVWLLLPFVPDWRWLLQRDDSPWYPTMRLFRQPSPGVWEPVIQRVACELRAFTQRPA
jgi:tetratricopeptide (TPR) repeat protein